MMVENKINKEKIKFKFVSGGDCFQFHDCIFIKIRDIDDINAVNVQSGTACFFESDVDIFMLKDARIVF